MSAMSGVPDGRHPIYAFSGPKRIFLQYVNVPYCAGVYERYVFFSCALAGPSWRNSALRYGDAKQGESFAAKKRCPLRGLTGYIGAWHSALKIKKGTVKHGNQK